MKNIAAIPTILFLLFVNEYYAQNIINTLGAGGLFKVKDATTDFFTLDQSNGTITLPLQLAGNQRGSIFKGTNRFLHTYNGSGTDGYNTFLGINAGNFTMGGVIPSDGSYNTGVGYQSLNSNTTGYNNSAFGKASLYSNTTGYYNSAFGYNSLGSNTTGYSNSTFGYWSLYSNETGINNTAIGRGALGNNKAGNNSTAVGYYAMFYANNTTTAFDNFNVAVGYEALRGSITPANNTGNSNTAIGFQTLINNTSGDSSTALGYQTLYTNTTGYSNTASGSQSLLNNTTGYHNTASGVNSLRSNTTGRENSAFGYDALYSNVSGRQNTAIGHHSLEINTGNYNTALGYNAGSTVTSGSNLTLIGIDANPSSPTSTNQITLGNQYVSSLRCNVTTITSLSDTRDKKNIKDLDLGIDFLMKIKPRQFNWDKREWYEGNISDGSRMKVEPTAGFIAQELDEVQTTENAEWLNLVLKDNPDKLEATSGNLLPIMVKAVQELKIQNEKLKIEKDQEIADLKAEISKYEEFQRVLVERLEKLELTEQIVKANFIQTEENNQ